MTTSVRAPQKTKSATEGTPSLLPAVRLLMEGISRHSVKGDAEEFHTFRSQMHHVLQSLGEGRLPHEAYDSAEKAVGLLKDYGHRTSTRLGRQSVELHAVIKMLLDTFRDLTIAGPKGMRQLEELGESMASTADGEALAQCKLKRSECLGEIRQEAERFRNDAGRTNSADARTGAQLAKLPTKSARRAENLNVNGISYAGAASGGASARSLMARNHMRRMSALPG